MNPFALPAHIVSSCLAEDPSSTKWQDVLNPSNSRGVVELPWGDGLVPSVLRASHVQSVRLSVLHRYSYDGVGVVCAVDPGGPSYYVHLPQVVLGTLDEVVDFINVGVEICFRSV